jgi:hypothetical protein
MMKSFDNVLTGMAELGFAQAWAIASTIALESETDDD